MPATSNVYEFSPALLEGIIVKRKNRFIFLVELDGVVHECHCPVTGSIGDIVFASVPCLVSTSASVTRKTAFTVEAISLDAPGSLEKRWIGINQNLANRYVENALRAGLLPQFAQSGATILREQVIGGSKLDFRIGDTYLEVKTPLNKIEIPSGSPIKLKNTAKPTGPNRFLRHIGELAHSVGRTNKAILLVAFIYDSPKYVPPRDAAQSAEVARTVSASISQGVEIWQINFAITKSGVGLIRHFEMTADFT